MKSSTKNRVRGKVREIQGKAKQKAGRLSGNRKLENQGTDDRIVGTIQNAVGKVQKELED